MLLALKKDLLPHIVYKFPWVSSNESLGFIEICVLCAQVHFLWGVWNSVNSSEWCFILISLLAVHRAVWPSPALADCGNWFPPRPAGSRATDGLPCPPALLSALPIRLLPVWTTLSSAEPQCRWLVPHSKEGFAKNEGKYISTTTFVGEINPRKSDSGSVWWSRDKCGTDYHLRGTAGRHRVSYWHGVSTYVSAEHAARVGSGASVA